MEATGRPEPTQSLPLIYPVVPPLSGPPNLPANRQQVTLSHLFSLPALAWHSSETSESLKV